MAGQTATMEFPVSINAQISNLKDLRTTLTNTLNAAGKDSSLAKTLIKDLAKVNQLISEAEEFTLSPTIDAAGLKALQGTFNKFFRQMQTSLQTIDLASFEQMASADDIARLKELTAEAAKYRRELEAINKSGSAEQTGKVLERTGNQGIAQRGSAYKEFNATATLNKNAAAMGKAADAYAQQAAAMQAGIDKLAQELSQAEASSEKAKNKAKILEQNLAAVNIDTRAADFHHKAGRFATNYSAEQNVKNPTLDTIQSGLRATLESVYAGGKIATDMRATVKDWIKNLLPNINDVDADNMVKKSVNDLLEDLMEGVFGSDYRSNPNLAYNVHHARILGNAQSYSAREIGRINAQYGVSGGQDLKVISAGISRELKQVRAEEREYTSEVDKKLTSWDEATDRQKEFNEAAAGARQLANELEKLAKAEQEAARAAKEAQIEENEQNQLALKNARTSGVKSSGAPGRQNMGDYKADAKEAFDDAGEVLGGKQAQIDEAAQFTANLKQSIKSWMSAQQIINIVKQGIRQAYQDIQNLDKAMTNIAVVTDMSVGDLWGKINEYMSIAQQYGVSTQGVYEVSQLYYQQGLGTADVMAATTETLKMARIAGMDYAEAADAMTVAIRSFKMEMSDAAHVTDVYSKVAAVTASDSEELAIAMSKTASSAESVGSSFENTTAMLAVMIETTRESAQNLGSALKSIISRYGEMKVGATVDAEGEALDYNKVDTALKSIGISIKDAQGQFRDFDDVIFELSEKWDSLDSVTQRYVATIMAGNRQQSRFIALVDNWERLDEVAGAAQDSEDAGLLQYAKTLDSLETKITNIKTSFQEFYMSIINGPLISAALEGINNILKGFNKLGNWQAILNIAGFIRSVKSIAKLLVSAISPSFSSIVSDFKSSMQEMVEVARQKGYEAGKARAEGEKAGYEGKPVSTGGSGSTPTQQSWLSARMVGDKSGKTSWGSNSWNGSKMAGRVWIGGQLIGAAASIVGSSVAKDNQRAGAVISGVGNIAQGASMGAALGPWGAVIGGVIGGLASLPAVLDTFDPANVLAEKLEKAEEALSEANIDRATKREEARNLEATINNLEKLQKARYSSEEAEQAFIDASNAAFEQFPQLTATFDEAGNAIIDVINNSAEAEYLLVEARKQAAEATVLAASAELKVAQTKLEQSNLKMAKNQEAFVQYIVPDGRAYEGELEQAFSSFRKDADSIFDSQAKIDYQTAVYDRAGRWDETLNKMTPSAQLERDLIYATSMADFITAYERGRERIANGEDVTGGMALVLEKADSVMETVIEGTSSEGTWMERYNLQLQENQQLQESVRAGQKAVGYAYTNQLITNADPLNEANWKKINNSSSFLQKWVYEQAQLTDGDFVDGELTSDAMARVSQRFQSTLVDYESFFTSLGYQFEDFNNVIASASKGTLSSATLLDQFQALFGSDMSTWGSVVEQYWLTISGDIESNITRLKEDLEFNRAYDWSSYIKGEEYQQAIQSLPIAYFSQISEFADDIDTRLQSGALTNTQAEKIIKEYFKTLNALTSDTLGLTSSQLSEAQQLLTEAASNGSLFSITGIQELITQLANAGIDIEELNLDQFPVYTANLITEWASFEDKLVSNLTATTEAMQKASEGMTLEEATSLANRIDLDLTTDFEFIDGKWFTTNIQAIKAYYTAQTNAIKEKFNEQVEKLLGTDTSSGLFKGITEQTLNDLKGKKTVESLGENATEEQIALWQAVQTYWDQEHYQTWVANTKKEAGEDADTSLATYWAEYFTNLGQTIETATAEALEYWTNESQKQAEAATRLAALKSQSQVQADKISAYETIASQGAKGYSPEDLNTIIGALGWDSSHYVYDSRTGTYELTEKALNSIPLLYRNQILASIDAEVQAATQAIESLGGNIFDASDADYSEAFSYLAEAGFQGKEIKKGINYALMQSVVGDPDQLEEYIGRELAHKMGRDYNKEFATEFGQEITASRENMVAAFKDSYIERIRSYNDLVYKKIVGTATFAELEELEDISVDLDIDLSEFTGRLIDDLSNYAQSVIDNAYLSAEDKNKYLKDTFGTMLGARAYAQVYGLDENLLTQDAATRMADFSAANKAMRTSKNRITQDQAAEFAAAYANMIGMDPRTILSSFDYNESDSTFSYDAALGTTARDIQLNSLWAVAERDAKVMAVMSANKYASVEELLKETSGDKLKDLIADLDAINNAEVLNILGNYRYFEQLADAAKQATIFGSEFRADKYATAVEQFTSGQETTFEELVNLYSDLGQTFNTNELYALWQRGPEAIATEIMRLAEEQDSTLTSAQLEEIQAAKQRGAQALLESITAMVDKAISGTATLDDLFAIAKNTGIDLTGKVAKTSSGYGLNQTGMLEVAAWKAMRSGDYSGEAQKLVESYAGKGGIFNSVDSITTRIDITTDALDGVTSELQKLQQQEEEILANESEEAKKAREQAKKEREQTKAELEQRKLLLEAENNVLAQAESIAKQNAAKNAANFMGVDPLNGAGQDFQNYLNSRSSAKQVLQAAYGNKGVISDFNQAMQLMSFIGYGQEDWDAIKETQAYNTLFAHTGEDGTNFVAAYREIFGEKVAGMTDSEVLLHAAQLMDSAADKMSKELKDRIQANEAYAKTYKSIMDDTNARVAFKDAEKESKELIKDKKLDTQALYSRIEAQYGKDKLGITQDVITDIAKTRYGADWETALSDVQALSNFLTSIDEIVANFQFDPTSSQSYEEQLISYAKGESAAQTVEDRLKQLSDQIQGIVTSDDQMAPLIKGLDISIQKAEYLNSLLVKGQSGHVYSTGRDSTGATTGVIYTDASNVDNPDNKGTEALFKAIGSTFRLTEDQVKQLQFQHDETGTYVSYKPKATVTDKTGQVIGSRDYTQDEINEDPSKGGFKYYIRPMSELSKTGKDPNGEFEFKGNFEEVEKWIEENKHIEAVYTLTTPKESIDKLTKNWQQAEDEAKLAADALEGMVSTDTGYDEMVKQADEAWAKAKTLKEELADLQTRYPTPDDGTVQLKVTGTAPKSDAELIKWKEDLAKALEGAGNVSLKIVDDKGNIISDINSITKGQQITISAGLAEGTSKDTIQTLVDDVNKITGGLKGATVQIGVTGLTADTVATVTNLKTELEKLKQSPAASGVTIDISGNAATNAAEIIKNINAATNDGKPHEASLNFKVSYTVDGKAVTFDEKGLPVLPKADEDTVNENANDGDKEDPGSITLTIKGVDPKSAEEAKKSIDKLGKDVQITFKQGDKEFTDVTDLADKPVEIQIQYKVDEETGEQTSEEIVKAIGEIAGEKPVNITVTGLDDTTATKVTQLATDLAGLKNPPETINIEVKDKDGKSLTLANDFATKLGAIKSDYESTITVTVKYVDENGKSVNLDKFTPSSNAIGDTTQNTQNVQSPTPSLNEVLDELSNLADQAGTTAQQEADDYKQRIQQMEQEKTEVERKMESSPTLLSEYYHQYAEKYLRGDSEWSQQRQSYAQAKSTATDTVDETEEVIEEIQAIKEEAASIALITDDTEAQAALDNLNAKISKLVSSHPTLFINVKIKSFTLEDIILPAGEKAPSTDGTGQYTGNVNGIAYANGNVDSLIAGAHLANKTLVGELGPELGVWDGMYHLLGQNGAEFVNMPDDAIVFNHRQTEGILKGQMGHRGKALADGNVTGPARANSYTINPWEALTGFKSYEDFVSSLGKGGSKSYKFTEVGELEEWYNLLRKIAKLEAEINLIQAERENITDGHDYLKSLREQQAYLNEEIAVQKLLIDYKKEQLALERERIEQDEWWSKSLTFNEDGTLLSIFGNEVGGGEGVFAYLDMLNNLSGDQQVAALKKLGYSYIGKDGKALEGDELVKQFISEYQDVVGSYNELDDSILEAETTVASLTTAINELEQEIKDNQKELEQAIYDLLVEASEREIEQTEKQNELLKEANQKYIDGLNDALSKEQQLYEQNKAIEDRESLQRQLSLLRRSGGSASEIEALEQQLDDALKSEYFDQQQKMIEDIADANERQAELLEQQVKLQQDALEYQKENGVIWTKVYEVMSDSYEEILDFFTGQDTKFFEASALAQESMLLQWAKMVGIYDEDRASKQAKKDATAHWTNGTLDAMFAEDETVSEYTNKDGTKGTKTRQEQYNELSDKDKKAAQEHYVAAYTDAILKGQTAEQARQTAYNSMVERFRMDADQGITRWDPRDKDATKGNPNGTTYQYSVPYTVYFVDGQIETGEGRGISKENARDWAEYYAKKRTASKQKKNAKGDIIYHGGAPVRNIEYGTPVKLYATGGLVDYTGVAMVHGSKSKPESFLNSDQTAQITQALRETTGKESILGSLQSTMEKLKSVIHNISTIDNSNNQSISIAPGAVVIQVEQLADSYDIEEVSRDVMNRMVAIANKATNRGVNRR